MERERQTLDLLLVTKMRPISIIIGKMVAGLSIVLLMIVSSLPVFAIVFYFGGISIGTFLKMTVFMIVTACMAGAVSILLSTIIKKSMISTVLVYLIFGVLCIGTLVGAFLYYGLLYSRYYALNITTPFELGILSKIFINILLSINPGVAFFSLIENEFGMNIVSDVISVGSNTILDNIWIFNIIFNIVVTGILLVLASKFINPLRKK